MEPAQNRVIGVLSNIVWRIRTDDTIYRANVEQIGDFPDNDKTAMIKAQSDGKLYRADGMGYSRVWGWAFGTTLKPTVEHLKNVSETAIKHFSEDLEQLRERIIDERDFIKLRTLKDDLVDELKVLEGLQSIECVYTERYQDKPNHEGLKELHELTENYSKQVKKSVELYSELVSQVKARAPNEGPNPDLTETLIMTSAPPKNVSDEEAAKDLSNYVAKWCPGVKPGEAAKLIQEGKALFNKIMSGERKEIDRGSFYGKWDETEHEVTALTWYLMSVAIKNGQGFNEGTFVIEDPDDRLYNFLMSADPNNLHTRPSTHYKGRSPAQQHGVDVVSESYPLPAQKRTLLFTQAENPPYEGMPPKVLMIKPENYSAKIHPKRAYDAVMHGYEVVMAQAKKVLQPGSDDLDSMRKERVPRKELDEFNRLVEIIEKGKPEEKDSDVWLTEIFDGKELGPLKGNLTFLNVRSCAKKYGIAFMVRFIDSVKQYQKDGGEMPADFDPASFDKMMNKHDHPYLRTGREVYIPAEDVKAEKETG